MLKIKLLDQNMQSHGWCRWTLGEEKTVTIPGTKLCTNQVFHFYDTPEMAVVMNPAHANIRVPRMFECDCDPVAHDGLKGGSKRMCLVKEIAVPLVSLSARIRFAIYCVKSTCKDRAWLKWADDWLSGTDRSAEAAKTAETGVEAAAKREGEAVMTMVRARRQAARAALAVRWATEAAEWRAAGKIALAAQAMEAAAIGWAAVAAAEVAEAHPIAEIDFSTLLQQAIQEEDLYGKNKIA